MLFAALDLVWPAPTTVMRAEEKPPGGDGAGHGAGAALGEALVGGGGITRVGMAGHAHPGGLAQAGAEVAQTAALGSGQRGGVAAEVDRGRQGVHRFAVACSCGFAAAPARGIFPGGQAFG